MKAFQKYQANLVHVISKRIAHTPIYCNNNCDLKNVPNFRGNFSKALPHKSKNEVSKEDYIYLLKAIRSCNPKYLSKVKLGNPNGIKLIDINAIFDAELFGKFKASYKLPAAPSILSDIAAGELIELYAMALARDIPFINYDTDPLIQELCDDLNLLSNFKGPKVNGKVTPKTIFRGNTQGDLVGPYVSQFLLLPFKYGVGPIIQKYPCSQPNINYLTAIDKLLDTENGTIVEPINPPLPDFRFLHDLRGCTDYIRDDLPSQPFVNAALILQGLGVKFFPGSPYVNETISNQSPFVDLALLDVLDLLGRVSKLALDACWYVKWTNLKLRPEEFGYQVQLTKTGEDPLNLHSDLLNNPILDKVFNQQGNYLLSQAYRAGCPAHPSYPSGHATLAGAQSTILKAFFDYSFILPNTYVASADGFSLIEVSEKVSVGGELDKLASNCANFRNAAGIHYRSDTLGLELGEAVGIELLKEIVWRYTQPVTFSFTKRNGEHVVITNKK